MCVVQTKSYKLKKKKKKRENMVIILLCEIILRMCLLKNLAHFLISVIQRSDSGGVF